MSWDNFGCCVSSMAVAIFVLLVGCDSSVDDTAATDKNYDLPTFRDCDTCLLGIAVTAYFASE